MKRGMVISVGMLLGMALPFMAQAQDTSGGDGSWASDIHGLQAVLEQLYNNLIPQCSQLIGVGRGIAGFAATWYIAYRVWGHLARAEPIDFFPLLRPFALGLAILFFPTTIAVLNGILEPAVDQTQAWVTNSNGAIAELLKEKQAAYQGTANYQMYLSNNGAGDKEAWEKYSGDADSSWSGGLTNGVRFALDKAMFNLKNAIKVWVSELLQLFYEAAALCINTIRTFYLIILAILGPLVFGLSVFDGMGHTLRHWLAKYMNVFLWLPVCNIFGAITNTIQEQMIQLDINQIKNAGDTYFGATDTGYLIFLIIAIVGYSVVPAVAGYIVNAGGHSLLARTNMFFGNVVNFGGTGGGGLSQGITGAISSIAGSGPGAGGGSSSRGSGSSSGGQQAKNNNSYQYKRVKGDDA